MFINFLGYNMSCLLNRKTTHKEISSADMNSYFIPVVNTVSPAVTAKRTVGLYKP